MKILLSSHKFYPEVGGIEINSHILASNFIAAGHKVTIVTSSILEKPFHCISSLAGYAVVRCPSPAQLLRLYLWSDVVFQNNIELRSLWPILLVQRPSVIAVLTWLRDPSGRVRPIDRFKRWVLSRSTRVIAISEAIRTDSCSSSIVIGNPYRSGIFKVLQNHPRSTALAFLGRLVSDKGADLLIDAFLSLLSDRELRDHLFTNQVDFNLTIIGDGPEKASLIAKVINLGISDRVFFTGVLQGEPLVSELNSHCVLAVPSRWPEPFGNVALEGIACGCVVVAADSGGLPDAVGNAGLLFHAGDVVDLSAKLREALMLPDSSLARLSKVGTEQLVWHSEAAVSKRYLDVLHSAYSSNG